MVGYRRSFALALSLSSPQPETRPTALNGSFYIYCISRSAVRKRTTEGSTSD